MWIEISQTRRTRMRPPARNPRLRWGLLGFALLWLGAGGGVVGLELGLFQPPARAADSGPAALYNTEYSITIDASKLEPPTRWYVPGVTPIIWSLDPDSTDAYKTTDVRQITIKPGHYRFGTFTFDFPFDLTLEGVVDFSPKLDQCVAGRGTKTLAVLCTQTQPYARERDYWTTE
ncbi:MAG: hypothetical protein ACREI3_06890 [Nitrospirales bacterium]